MQRIQSQFGPSRAVTVYLTKLSVGARDLHLSLGESKLIPSCVLRFGSELGSVGRYTELANV